MSIFIQEYLENLDLYCVLVDDGVNQITAYMNQSELEDLPIVINPEEIN